MSGAKKMNVNYRIETLENGVKIGKIALEELKNDRNAAVVYRRGAGDEFKNATIGIENNELNFWIANGLNQYLIKNGNGETIYRIIININK